MIRSIMHNRRQPPCSIRRYFFISRTAAFRDSSSNNSERRNDRVVAALGWTVHPESGIISYNDKPLFQTIIGMEIHAQLDIPTKLFSSATTPSHGGVMESNNNNNNKSNNSSSNIPNTIVWPLDVAVPGVLPRLSLEAVQAAVLTAAACNCDVSSISRFERKHYAYADLPLGYQITQQRWPIATNGYVKCRQHISDPKIRHKRRKMTTTTSYVTAGIDRIQLEQDTGKTIVITRRETNPDDHNTPLEEQQQVTTTESLIDFNRAGCALVEIVFRPDLRSSMDASSVVSTLRDTMRYIGTCNGRMEEGALRCDLNISIAPLVESRSSSNENEDNKNNDDDDDEDNPFQTYLPPGTGRRVEVKNLNSIKQVYGAAQYEALRQAMSVSNGVPIERETRTFDVRSGTTVAIRSKEGAVDYRFMPEPDLPPLVLNEQTFDGLTLDEFLAKNLPELPEQATLRLMEEYALSEEVALVITGDPPAVAMYEEAVNAARRALCDDSSVPKKLNETVANWLCNDLFALVKESTTPDEENSVQFSCVDGTQLGELVAIMAEGMVSTTMGKKILAVMYHDDIGKMPRQIAEERNWRVVSDLDELRAICLKVINDHETQLDQYSKGGKHVRKMKKFFLGKAMAESRGNADPELLNYALEETLDRLAPNVV